MAPYIASIQNWDALLQDEYVTDGIRKAVNDATPFMNALDRSATTDTSGRQRVAPVQVGISQGQGARGENKPMPAYGAGKYVDATTRSFYNYAPFKVTGPAMEFGTKKAFAEFGMRILKDTKQGFKMFTGRQCWGDGQGILALVNNGGGYTAGTTTLTVDSPYGVLWGSLATLTTALLNSGASIQFGTEDNATKGYEVNLVGSTTISIIPALQNAIADNAPITNLGSANYEIEGFLKFAATAAFQTTLGLPTTYHGIDRALYPQWEGNAINVNAALSFNAVRAVRTQVWKRSEDDSSNVFMTSPEVYDAYEALFTPNMRYTPMEFPGGRKGMSHDGLFLSRDSRAPTRAFALVDTGAMKWMETRPPHWMQEGNGSIMRIIAGLDAMEALLRWYSNMDVEEPRRMAIAFNITGL